MLAAACSPVTLKADSNGEEADADNNNCGEPNSCEGDTLRQCVGEEFENVECALGCSDTGGAHCRQLHPAISGKPLSMHCADPASLELSVELIFDTSSGEIVERQNPAVVVRRAGEGVDEDSGIGFQVIEQVGQAPAIGLFTFDDLLIANGEHLVSGQRVAGLLACGTLNVAGRLDLSANGTRPGPGGNPPVTLGGAPAGPGAGGVPDAIAPGSLQAGGGGAGFGGEGGEGEGTDVSNPGGDAGKVYGMPVLSPLVGGSGGGHSGGGRDGGAGGGAIYLGAGEAILFSGGAGINVGGGGGANGTFAGSALNGGGGGGSGGAILLDAPSITLEGGPTLAANGGGGGARSQAGENGLLSKAPAGPNPGGADRACDGRAGAGNQGAGGGGGCGRIRILSRDGEVGLGDAIVSPPPDSVNSLDEPLLSQDEADIK